MSGNKSAYNSASLFSQYSPEEMQLESGYGSGLDMGSQKTDTPEAPAISGKKDMATGANLAMNAGGSPASVLTSAGAYGLMGDAALLGAGGATLGAGLALGAYEQHKKARAMEEQARIKEAEQRKAAVQDALNQALGATRQLGV